ncbi:MAG: hypothetical protein KY439_03805 [Actinobacteria bacterium]|nr:hypothetical protein [Actinomycetota bacterium]
MRDHTANGAGRGDLDLELVGFGFAFAAALLVLPALLIAAPLALLIEGRGWRRWPALAAGAAATALAVRLGAWEAYVATLTAIGRAVRGTEDLRLIELLGLGPLAVPAGVTAGPILDVLWTHRNEHEATRHSREVVAERRARVQADRVIARGSLPAPAGRTVLGLRTQGSIKGWQVRHRGRIVVAPPAEAWARQALILGETGSGKTVTALGLAAELLRAGWDVHWIDGKSDRDTRDAFLAAASAGGVTARDGMDEPIDGWRGGHEAIVNRLLATQHFSEDYYEGIARTVLRTAVGERPPRSFHELIDRLDKKVLVRAGADRRRADFVRQIPDRDFIGVRSRYEGIAWAVGDHLDGDWSYEDTRASYVPVGRPENRHQAAEVGAFILEDVLHWALARKPRGRRAVVIIDEFSKLSDRPDAAVDLVERARASGLGVVLIAQTWASLGPDDTIRDRLAGTVGTVILHQLKQPDQAAGLAGTKWVMERTEQTLVADHTGLGSQRAGNRYVVHPDDVRRLRTGEAFVLHAGAALRTRVQHP